ncbi:60S ribosomal protein L10a, partial [Cucurbita argyrosperma subsp. argyrosperma]
MVPPNRSDSGDRLSTGINSTPAAAPVDGSPGDSSGGAEKFKGCCGFRERLKRHREEVAGKVTVPEKWGKEELLKDWIDYSAFDRILAAGRIASARASLVAEGRRVESRQFVAAAQGRQGSENELQSEALREAISSIFGDSSEKKRNFTETIELQIGLKNYDPQKDKRFSGSVKLPHIPRPKMKICMLGDALHVEEAEKIGLDYMDVEGLKKLNKNKKLASVFMTTSHSEFTLYLVTQVWKLFLAFSDLVRTNMDICIDIAGKFPTLVTHQESLESKVNETKAMVKFQLKKVLCMGVAVGNVAMEEKQVFQNVQMSVNFLVSLLKKNWQNVRCLYLKSTMGKAYRVF